MTLRLAINRTCAPHYSLAEFITLAGTVRVQGVEIRNDIDGREFADGTPATEVRARLEDAGLAVASVNALQRFNDWNPARAAEAEALIAYAARLGAPGVVLCPVHNADHGWSDAEAERNLRHGLKELRPILRDHGVIGYVEPLGMKDSTMKRQDMAVAAISDCDAWDAYKLCYDTFQFFRCSDTRLFPEHTGLVHISGIARADLPPGDLVEPDRGLVDPGDRVGNIERMKALRTAGYQGYFSMEPFNPAVQQDRDLAQRLKSSLAHVASQSAPTA